MRLAVMGASGRMGRAVIRLASAEGIAIVGAVGASDIGADVGQLAGIGPLGVRIEANLSELSRTPPDVIVDFSAPEATVELASWVAGTGTAIVSGTTALGEVGASALERAAEHAAVLWEPNMSVGIQLLAQFVAQAAKALPNWEIELVEVHHRAKVDAPSGTALLLAEAAGRARPGRPRFVHGREGKPGPRASSEIAVHAVRGGDVVGDHTVHLFGSGERLELVHRATSRDVFAHGALLAARWIAGKPPGRYRLADVVSGGEAR
jgi:4-hydroxy-tetrahydrodipicolinate reductase